MSGPQGSGGHDLFEAAGGRRGEHRILIVLGIIGLALALVLAAFFAGREFTERDSPVAERSEPLRGSQAKSLAEAAVGAGSGKRSRRGTRVAAPNGRLVGKPYRGRVRPVEISRASATCRAKPRKEGGGRRVSYPASNMLDDARRTAWRCRGNGRGVKLRFKLDGKQTVAAVGMVPGYAKTGPRNGVDRYARNRRISKVRWSFDGGVWTVQRFDVGRKTRRMQMKRIPRVRTRWVTVTIRNSTPGRRNAVAVSAVRLAGPRR